MWEYEARCTLLLLDGFICYYIRMDGGENALQVNPCRYYN